MLDLEVNDAIVNNCLDLMKQIYQDCDMEHNAIQKITFFPINRMNSEEKAEFVFEKSYGYGDVEGQIIFRASIWSDQLSAYKAAFKEAIRNDDFYNSKRYVTDTYSDTSWPWDPEEEAE